MPLQLLARPSIAFQLSQPEIPILLGHDFWIFHVPKLPRYGFWSMLHEGRADFCLLVGSLYLSIEGGGKWSFDALLSHDHSRLSD